LDQSIILRQEANNLPNNFPVLERAAMVKALGTLQGGGLPVAGDGFGVGERDNLVLPVVDDEAGDGQLGDGRFHNHRFQGKADPVYQFLAHFFNSGGRYAQEAGPDSEHIFQAGGCAEADNALDTQVGMLAEGKEGHCSPKGVGDDGLDWTELLQDGLQGTVVIYEIGLPALRTAVGRGIESNDLETGRH
jgi:hypothetical protein